MGSTKLPISIVSNIQAVVACFFVVLVFMAGVGQKTQQTSPHEATVPMKEPIAIELAELPMMEMVGQREQWLYAAGVPINEWPAAMELVQRESSWNPSAVNPSSGACSLVQSLPCSKIEGDWQDPVTALRWGNEYVNQRYGGWSNALAFWHQHKWY